MPTKTVTILPKGGLSVRYLQIPVTQKQIQNNWEEYYPKVFGYFFRRLNNQADVEELTSLVLTKFINKLSDQNSTLENPHGYLWKIARSKLADFINQKTKQPATLSLDHDLDTIPEDLDKYRSDHYKQKTQDLMECVQKNLKENEYKIVELCVMYDQKAVEIAEVFKLKPENIRQKLSRSLKKLRKVCIDLWQKHHN